jgi:hypothetical protein
VIICAVDYVLEEKGLKKDGVKMYEEYVKERKIFIYNTVKVVREDLKGPPTLAEDEDVVKCDYNILQEI